MIYSIGCDMSKDTFDICLVAYRPASQHYQVKARTTFDNIAGGWNRLLRWAGRQVPDNADQVRCSLEATGVYHEGLALHVRRQRPQWHLSVVLPSQARCYANSRGLRNKTDKIDAYGIALMGAERRLQSWGGIDPFWRALRQLTRTRVRLQRQLTALRNQLHAVRHSGMPNSQVMEGLERLIGEVQAEINRLKRLIEQKLSARNELAERIGCLESIPGIGSLTIATILAETTGFAAFHSKGQLMSFSGYDLVIRDSGNSKGKRTISKQGSSYIRHAMYMPANTVIRMKLDPLHAYYTNQLAKSDNEVKMKAHVALQKKLLSYMYFLWKKAERFDPEQIRRDYRRHQGHSIKKAPPEDGASVDTLSHEAA